MRLKKRHIQSFEKLSDIGKLLQIGLWAQGEKFFGTRSNLNEEVVTYLDLDKEFKQKIGNIRREFNIPKLSPDDDLQIVPLDHEGEIAELEVYQWLESQPEEKQQLFDKAIYGIIEMFQCPLNFYDWLKNYILYGKPSYIPAYNLELVDQVINYLDEIERFALTTQEKKFVLAYFRWRVSQNKRITKAEFRKSYKQLKEALNRSKNRRRRFRTFETAVKTLKIGKQVSYYEPTLDSTKKTIKRKLTSIRLATELFEDEEIKKSHMLRKQKQRLKERMKFMLNKK